MKKLVLIFILSISFLYAQTNFAAKEIFDSLTPLQRAAQLFLVNIQGNKDFVPVEYIDDDTPFLPGGILLFSYNIAETKAEISTFTSSINSFYDLNKIPRPFIAVDQEGGVVNRLRGVTSPLMSQKNIALNYSPSQSKSIYSSQAEELKECGINLNLAPVTEAAFDFNKDFLDSRSFGSIPKTVAYSMAAVSAYEEKEILSCIKHFPGNTNTDPHSGLPQLNLSIEQISENLLLPFDLILNAKPSCVLMSHALSHSIDSGVPACLSKIWCTKILKELLGFDGLVISDDIFMDALNKNGYPPEEAAVKALEAGVHIIMLSEKRCMEFAEYFVQYANENKDFAKILEQAELKVIETKMEKLK